MPTYEFRCPDGHEFDRFYKSISAAPSEVACPECGKMAERLISGGAGFAFKGSGFYLTDYGKNAHRKSGPESKKSDSKADSKSDVKADSKATAAKAESSAPKSESPKPKPKSE